MRLWSIHPRFLDHKGLGGVWREGLLAKAVIEGKTKGYKKHPQLDRFRSHPDPSLAIQMYLWNVIVESRRRGYSYNASKLPLVAEREGGGFEVVAVTEGQVNYEVCHLAAKLLQRSPKMLGPLKDAMLLGLPTIVSPFFRVVSGDVEPWERIVEDKEKINEQGVEGQDFEVSAVRH